jgi:DNA-binding response OmpR family regulator
VDAGPLGHVLLIEDDRQLNEINRRALTRAGYNVTAVLTLAAARQAMALAPPDVIVLDVGLPDGNGADFCSEIRPHTAAPILFLTASHGYEDELHAMMAGGDDYLKKPYDLQLLIAKIAAFRRRDQIAERHRPVEKITVGPVSLDLVSRQATVDQRDLGLTSKEFSLLVALAQAGGNTVTTADLYAAAWNRPMLDDPRSIWTHLSSLKRKLAQGVGSSLSIVSSRGQGYSLQETRSRKS